MQMFFQGNLIYTAFPARQFLVAKEKLTVTLYLVKKHVGLKCLNVHILAVIDMAKCNGHPYTVCHIQGKKKRMKKTHGSEF